MAFLALSAGLIGLLHLSTSTDILTSLLPTWLVSGLNASYALSGLAMLVGLGLGRRDLEGGGIALLMSAVLVRGLAVVLVAGVTLQVSALLLFYLGFLVACGARLQSLVKNEVVLKVRNHGTIQQHHQDIDAEQLQMRGETGPDDDR